MEVLIRCFTKYNLAEPMLRADATRFIGFEYVNGMNEMMDPSGIPFGPPWGPLLDPLGDPFWIPLGIPFGSPWGSLPGPLLAQILSGRCCCIVARWLSQLHLLIAPEL